MPRRAKPQATNTIAINTNTIVGIVSTLIGGVVLYMVTTGMGQVKQTATDVKEVKTVLPFMQHAIDSTQAEVKEAKTTAKADLDAKHQVLWSALKDNKTENEKHYENIAGEIKEVKTEQTRVREDLMKQSMNQPNK